MPTTKEKEVMAFAHCPMPRCPGGQQEEVAAIKVLTERTYREMGGDSPGVEVSWELLRFADEDERDCPHCGKVRELSNSPRVQYAPLSGHDPNGLLGVPQFDPAKQAEASSQPVGDPEREQMQAEIAQLRQMVAELVEERKAE